MAVYEEPMDHDAEGTGEKADSLGDARIDSRLCLTCGRRFPETQSRYAPGKGCTTPEVCSIDMTMREALDLWRERYHSVRMQSSHYKEVLGAIAKRQTSAELRQQADAGGEAPAGDFAVRGHDEFINRARMALSVDYKLQR